jgi:hypothetical protein
LGVLDRSSNEPAAECLVAWRDADGAVSHAGPLTRDRAEALVEAYGRLYPNQPYWVESLPDPLGRLRLGRVRGERALSRRKADGPDH